MRHQLPSFTQLSMLAVLCCSLFSWTPLLAQSSDNHLIVLGDAAEEVPADQASLTIGLSYSEEKDITLVYEQHKVARERLLAMLTELKIADKDVQVSPIVVRKDRDYSMGGGNMGPPAEKFRGYQRVVVKFDDLKRFTIVQQHLSSNGFTDLNTMFSTSKQRETELKLYDQAVARAREKADRLAKAASQSVKRVVRIGEIDENEPMIMLRANMANQYMISYNQDPIRTGSANAQLVRISALVKVVFEMD